MGVIKKAGILLGVIVMLIAAFLFIRLWNNPIRLYERFLAREDKIKTAKETVLVNIKNKEERYLSFDFLFTENKEEGLLKGDMKALFAGKQLNTKVFQKEGKTYFQQDNGTYLTVNAKSNELFDGEEYRKQVIDLFKNDKSLRKLVTVKKGREGAKSIVFKIPSEKVAAILKTVVKSAFLNDKVKETAVKQAVVQLQRKFAGQISNTEIEQIVQEQMNEMDKKIEAVFDNLSVINAEYTVFIDKKGFLTKEVLSVKLKKGELPLDFVFSHNIDGINRNYNITIPKFTGPNTVKASSFAEAFAILLKK